MKTYVLMLAKKYPKGQILEGQETRFEQKIRTHWKIHTVRQNYELWKKRFEEINEGRAQLSVREWIANPYRSKQKELFLFDRRDRIGIEKLDFDKLSIDQIKKIGYNDGLSYPAFEDWFKNVDKTKPLAIIHFTKFRYND